MLFYDHHTKTCCCFHVKKCAFCFALFGFLFNLLALIPIFLPHSPTSQENQSISIGKTLHLIISTAMFLSIMVAYKFHKAWLYKPYLVYVGISLVLTILGCFTYLYFLITDPQSLLDDEWRRSHGKEEVDNSEARSIAVAWLGLIILYVAFNAWIYSIIYRAFVVQKEEEHEQNMARGTFAPV